MQLKHQTHLASLTVFLLTLGLPLFVIAQQQTTNAKLLVDKEILNKYIVEGRDVLVNYHLINIGGSVARDIRVVDDTFTSDRFDIITGYTTFTYPSIAPGVNVTHAVVIRPKLNSWGPYRFGPARVEYKLNDAGQLQLSTTSERGEIYVGSARSFDKKFSSQFFDWIIFAILCIPSIAGPYYFWFKSDSKFSSLAGKQTVKKVN